MTPKIVHLLRSTTIVSLCSLVLANSSVAQEAEAVGDSAQSDSVANIPENTLVPLPVLFYTPETDFGFGGLASYYFYPSGGEGAISSSRVQPSNISAMLIYTVKRQTVVRLEGQLYPGQGRYRTRGSLGYTKFPNTFWGIGNDSPERAEEDYTPVSFELSFELQKQLLPTWYFGVVGQLAHRALRVVEEGGLLDGGLVPGTSDGRVIGFGVSVTRDHRDNTVYPRSGGYHQLTGQLYDGVFGSEYEFASLTIDLRKFVSPVSGHVLALRVLGQGTTGTVPFDLMPQLGGDNLLRGYFGGRFRDQDLVSFQVEYRVPVWWRFGAVGYVSAGQVAPRLDQLALGRFKPAAGFGLRILLSPEEGLNIRADYGWGFDVTSTGFYLSIGEAF